MKVSIIKKPSEEDWLLVKRAAFRTIGKDTDTEPTLEWKHRMLAAVHSPIRMLNYTFLLEDIPSWVSVHLVRHVHALPFVQSQRNDRCNRNANYDRTKAPQDTPVSMIWHVNAEELMTIAHKRLCLLASKETRGVVQDICKLVRKECPEWGNDLLVPLCTYRNGICTEFKPCEYYIQNGHGFIKTLPFQLRVLSKADIEDSSKISMLDVGDGDSHYIVVTISKKMAINLNAVIKGEESGLYYEDDFIGMCKELHDNGDKVDLYFKLIPNTDGPRIVEEYNAQKLRFICIIGAKDRFIYKHLDNNRRGVFEGVCGR